MSEESVMRARERPPAEDHVPNDVGGSAIINARIAAARFLLDGHFRNNRNAHARADPAEQAAELAALENNLRVQARAVAGRDSGIAEAVAIAKK